MDVGVTPSSYRQALTADGRVLGCDSAAPGSLSLWSRYGKRPLIPSQFCTAIVNDLASWVLYEQAGESGHTTLRAFELSSSRDILLASRAIPPNYASIDLQPSLSNDGTLALYVSEPADGQPPQAFLVHPDGTGRRQLTAFVDGISEAVLAGDGKVVVAVTLQGRLVRIDTATAAVQDILSAPAHYSAGFLRLTPGSILPFRGTGLADSTRYASFPLPRELGGVRVLVDGAPMPMLSVSPQEAWFQVPFELPLASAVRVWMDDPSPFDWGVQASVERRFAYFFSNEPGSRIILSHEGFSGVVTEDSPARPGEIVTAFGVGLGYVKPELPTGVLTPTTELYRVADPFDCTLGGAPAEVLFAGLAPALIGIYQVNVRLPDPLPATPTGLLFLSCGTPGSQIRHGGNVPVAAGQ